MFQIIQIYCCSMVVYCIFYIFQFSVCIDTMQPLRVIWCNNVRRGICGSVRKEREREREKSGGNARNISLFLSLASTTDQLQMLSTKRNAANACQDHALDTSHMTILWDIPSRERTGSGKREMCPGTSPREMCRQTRKSRLGKYQFIIYFSSDCVLELGIK